MTRLEERPPFKLVERLPELLLRVHHDRPIPRDRLLERLARDQQEADTIVAGLYREFVAAVKKYERPVVCLRGRRLVQPLDTFCRHRKRTGRVAEFPSS